MAQVNSGFVTDEYSIVNDQIPAYSFGYHNENPPNYEDIVKTTVNVPGVYQPPPQYSGTETSSQVISMPQSNIQNSENAILKYKKMHFIYGAISLVLGMIHMTIDPLLPAIFHYPYSMFIGGLFMAISGACSINGSRKNDKCSLKASLTFNILALLNIFPGYIVGIVAADPRDFFVSCKYSDSCYPNVNFYSSGIKGFGVFNTVFGTILFVLMIWDSSIKCGDICCFKHRESNVIINTNVHPVGQN